MRIRRDQHTLMGRNYCDRHFSFFKQIFLFSFFFINCHGAYFFAYIQIHGDDDGKWGFLHSKWLVNEENAHECRKRMFMMAHFWAIHENPQRYNCVAIRTNDQLFFSFSFSHCSSSSLYVVVMIYRENKLDCSSYIKMYLDDINN